MPGGIVPLLTLAVAVLAVATKVVLIRCGLFFSDSSRSVNSSSGQLPKTNHATRCRHCDGKVVILSTNDHLLLITRLLE